MTPLFSRTVNAMPSPQNALDIFRGEWAAKFPSELGLVAGGFHGDLFNDHRLDAAEERLGGFEGKSILELGPFEGYHTAMLEARGAAHITAIEANTRSFLKCLITKEVMGLTRTSVMLGNFVDFMRESDERFDILIASGVLYHLPHPDEALALMSRVSSRLFIQTHYYDPGPIAKSHFANQFTEIPGQGADGKLTYHRMEYQDRDSPLYNGGVNAYTHWLTRHDMLGLLEGLGFEIDIVFEETDNPNGPVLSFSATR